MLGGSRYIDGKQQLESAEYCRKAVRFLQDHVFTPPTWLFDRQIIDAVHADRQESIDKLYKSCMDSMRYALEHNSGAYDSHFGNGSAATYKL